MGHVPRVPRREPPTRRHPDVPRNGGQASSSTRFHPGPSIQTSQIQRVPTTTEQDDARQQHQVPTPTTSHVEESHARATILHQTTKHNVRNWLTKIGNLSFSVKCTYHLCFFF